MRVDEYIGHEHSERWPDYSSIVREKRAGAEKDRSKRRKISPGHRRTGEDKKEPVKERSKS